MSVRVDTERGATTYSIQHHCFMCLKTTTEERGEEASSGAHCSIHGREKAVKAEPEVTKPAPEKTALEDLLRNSLF